MKFIKKSVFEEDREVEIVDYIAGKISVNRDGLAENAAATAGNAAKAIGNLVNILREKGLLENSDIERVVEDIW